MTKAVIRTYALGAIVASIVLLSSPAAAQFRPRQISTSAVGDNYRVEVGISLWNPAPDMTLASTAVDVAGTTIDLKGDLGLKTQHFPDFQLVLRPNSRHKFRVEFIPLKYSQTGAPRAALTFAGQTFAAGATITSTINWKAWAFGYEYDFVSTSAGFLGIIVDLKYTDVNATMISTATGTRTASAKTSIPSVGAILRVNPMRKLALTGEITGVRLPWSFIKSDSGKYLDLNAYATLNLVNAFGVQLGYRSYDLEYTLTNDNGRFKLEGPYVGAALRF